MPGLSRPGIFYCLFVLTLVIVTIFAILQSILTVTSIGAIKSKMHIPGRSDILDQLAVEPNIQPLYDIRQLSHEIILRSGNMSTKWTTDRGTELTLMGVNDDSYRFYELYVQKANDSDIHHYVYSGLSRPIRYEYPLYTWHRKRDGNEIRNELEQWLLTGPVHDLVTDNRTENKIQKIFSIIARRLVMENIDENEPGYRYQLFNEILAASDTVSKTTIEQKLYDKSIELGPFTVSAAQFDLAVAEEMMKYRSQQKQLMQRDGTANE